jgi:hypothetical protein
MWFEAIVTFFKVIYHKLLLGTEKTGKNLIKNTRTLSGESNSVLPEHKTGFVITLLFVDNAASMIISSPPDLVFSVVDVTLHSGVNGCFQAGR